MVSILKTDKIQASHGTTIEIPSGHKLTAAAGSITAPGQVLQTLVATKTDTMGNTSTSFTDIPNMTITITPSSTSSKILFSWHVSLGINGDIAHGYINAVRDSTNLLVADAADQRVLATNVMNPGGASGAMFVSSGVFLDSPSTTSATVYKIQIKSSNGQAIYVNRAGRDTNNNQHDGRATSSMSVQEIAG